MSAIFGAISLDNNKIDLALAESIHEGYKDCKVDRYEIKSREDAFMACELQYFTAEAKDEVIPIIDEDNRIMFVADCYLDYRGELVENISANIAKLPSYDSLAKKLSISSIEKAPDGTLIYLAYLLWPDTYMDYLRGVFSFVAYHFDKGYVRLQSDHFACRCLHYEVYDNTLYFSSLFFPLIHGTGHEYAENERWLLDTLTLFSPMIVTEPEETAVLGVKKIVSGQYVNVTKDKVEKITYYNPEASIKTNKKITDKECEEKVRALMKKSVKEMLRTDGEVAVLLSAGLDSSMVACIAAPMLEKEGKKLHSYTSVPLKEAELPAKGYSVYDETNGVMKIVEAYPNIEPTFTDCPDKSILSEMDCIIKEWEMPCKSQQNAVWLREIKKRAAEDGSKIMLTGATGNCTISAGNFGNYLRYELSHLHLIRAYKGLNTYMNKYHGRKKNFVKSYIKSHLAYYTWYFDREAKDIYAHSMTNRELGEKIGLKKRLNKELLHYKPTSTLKRMRYEIYLVNAYAQMGELETASSLYRGLMERDPMRNVDFINYIMSLPMLCFNNAEYDRRLVREFMHDIVPEDIRLDVQHRGVQSGDNEYRVKMHWKDYEEEVKKYLDSEKFSKYIDVSQKDLFWKKVTADSQNADFMDVRVILDAYSFSKFLTKL